MSKFINFKFPLQRNLKPFKTGKFMSLKKWKFMVIEKLNWLKPIPFLPFLRILYQPILPIPLKFLYFDICSHLFIFILVWGLRRNFHLVIWKFLLLKITNYNFQLFLDLNVGLKPCRKFPQKFPRDIFHDNVARTMKILFKISFNWTQKCHSSF